MKKWWIIALSIVVVIVVLVAVFWNSIFIWIAPQFVVSGALSDLLSSLENRFQASPASILTEVLNAEGKYTAQMQLETSNEILGDIQYNMTVQTEASPRRVYAQGDVLTSGSTIDLSLYMDGDFAAVSSAGLLQGNYYGITYETFPEDIRGNILIEYLIGEETISQWEASIESLQASMNQEQEIQNIPQVDIDLAAYGILALKATVRTDVTDSGQRCHVVSFAATGAQIAQALDQYLPDAAPEIAETLKPLIDDPDSAVCVDFWLLDEAIIQLHGQITVDQAEYTLALQTGADAARDDLTIGFSKITEAGSASITALISTEYDDARYAEKIEILNIKTDAQDRTLLDYSWDRTSGDLHLNLTQGGEDSSIQMNFQEAEHGFRIYTGQFETLMGMLNDEKKEGNSVCTMTVSKGSGIAVPEYKNFDQWTLDDLLILLGGIGSLFGLKAS